MNYFLFFIFNQHSTTLTVDAIKVYSWDIILLRRSIKIGKRNVCIINELLIYYKYIIILIKENLYHEVEVSTFKKNNEPRFNNNIRKKSKKKISGDD